MRKELYLLLSFVLLVAPRFANAQKNERNKSTINKSSFYIPKGLNIEYKNLYTGIYEIKKDAINKSDHSVLQLMKIWVWVTGGIYTCINLTHTILLKIGSLSTIIYIVQQQYLLLTGEQIEFSL
jgi:hypothetical protein